MPRVLVADPIDQEGIDLLRTATEVDVRTGLSNAELTESIPEYDALVVRSETKVTAQVIEAGKRLQVIGRAGVGVDNIDLEAATQRGISVVNAPTGNTVAAAEHAIALMLALARHVPQAHASLKGGEWRRADYMGTEVRNKVLGIVGLGRVGSEVARRAVGFRMRLLAYDPFVSPDYARHLGVELVSMTALFKESDFITLHTPLTDATQSLIGRRELAKMKPSVRLINAARGGLIDEDALLQALNEGKVAGAAIDVFSREPPGESPLLTHSQVVVTPHLGGSTAEAQSEVAREAAEQVLAVLAGQPARSTVNMPFMPPEIHEVVAPYLETTSILGKVAIQLSQGQVISLSLHYEGDIAHYDTSILNAAALVGLLGQVTEERINLVNAGLIAGQRGIKIVEEKNPTPGEYASLITLELHTTGGTTTIGGTLLRHDTHIVRVNDHWLDMVPSGPYLLFIEHHDRPGMIGALGTITGKHDVNIAFMDVGRQAPRGKAVMVVGLDDPMSDEVLEEIRAVLHVSTAKLVTV